MAALFALMPAGAVDGVINYRTPEGRKLYENATKKLNEELYDCNAEELYAFLYTLDERATEYGWNDEVGGILYVPKDPNDLGQGLDYLIDKYGTVDVDRVRAHDESYINLQIRPAQDNYMLFRCLMASLSTEGKKKIVIWKEDYTIGDRPSGCLLLKVIIRESHLDTNATTASIWNKLNQLDEYLPTVGYNITKFNGYVKLLVDSLAARGETTQDLLINLFKGYLSAPDKEFGRYITRKRDDYYEGTATNPSQLMQQADAKYKTLVQEDKWNAPSAQEEKIIALQSQIKKLQDKEKEKKSGPKKGTRTFDKKKAFKDKGKQPWMTVRPSNDNLLKPKYYKNKAWWWCSPETGGKCNGHYRVHKPSECKADKFNARAKEKQLEKKEEAKLKLSKALEAVVEDDFENDQETWE